MQAECELLDRNWQPVQCWWHIAEPSFIVFWMLQAVCEVSHTAMAFLNFTCCFAVLLQAEYELLDKETTALDFAFFVALMLQAEFKGRLLPWTSHHLLL